MAYSAEFGRLLVLRARRDTVILVAAAVGMTFALASAIHSRGDQQGSTAAAAVDQQAWAGNLADVADTKAGAHELLTSASLVVPSAELALPKVAVRPLVKLHGCDGAACPVRAAIPVPAKRPSGGAQPPTVVSGGLAPSLNGLGPHRTKPSLMSRLNPFNHLPDITRIRRPFTVAGDTVTRWFRF